MVPKPPVAGGPRTGAVPSLVGPGLQPVPVFVDEVRGTEVPSRRVSLEARGPRPMLHLPFALPVLHLEAITPLMRVAIVVVLGMSILRCLREAVVVLGVIRRGRMQHRDLMIGLVAALVVVALVPVALILLGLVSRWAH